jgi:hypothetical protein
MSNPVATIGNSIPTPSDPSVERRTFTSVVFQEQKFFLYGDGEFDPSYTTFDPTNLGQRFFIFVPLQDVLDPAKTNIGKPEFITQESWGDPSVAPTLQGIRNARSGFLTGRYSIMPKIMVPSTILVDNGIITPLVAYGAYADPGPARIEAFNWEMDSLNGVSIPDDEMVKYAQIGAYFGSQYVTVRAKDDVDNENDLEMYMESPPQLGDNPPTPGPQGWDTGHDLVVDGAFMLMLNVVPSRAATENYENLQKKPWKFRIEFGDVIMSMESTGAMLVNFTAGADREENQATVNLAEGKTKEGPPQQEHIDDKQPYIIVVYPVWNGIIVMSGNQESREVINTSSTFIPMKKERSVLLPPYSNGFDPSNPAEVEVGVGSGATNTIPDFGDRITIKARNVRFEVAYLPVFFSRSMWFDEWFVASDDVAGVVDYTYNVYPIWTKNGTSAALGSVSPIQSSYAGPVSDTSYWYVKWRMEMDDHDRYAGEILGSVFEVVEERDFPIKNGNGNFNLNWTGGSPGDPSSSGDWIDYIQSLSVSISKDGSSGSITVDKYGVAGQDAAAIQDIGAITISMTGGYGTVAGSIFQGLGMGIAEGVSSDGATWEVSLVGLEKKMEDIALINVPFMDGETAATAIRFLTKYAGLNVNFAGAPNAATDRLGASEDVNVARFDWKSGTSVKSAMDDVMDNLQYNYVVRDGTVYIYTLNASGLPVFSGPDREPGYTETNIITEDQSPDFDVLRNEILVIGLHPVPEGTGTDIGNIPTFPRFEKRQSTTTPDVPWAKSVVRPIPGTLTEAEISDQADKLQAMTKNYLVLGRTTIPGNANIKPYDRWGNFYIYSVTHNVDFNAKTWTTDLEFSSSA